MIQPYRNRAGDRRERKRFLIRQEVRYRVFEGARESGNGVGLTLDMSSNGCAFTGDQPLRTGTSIELSICWPVLLDGHCPLRMVAHGYVVRSAGSTIACRLSRFEFRTQAKVAVAATETQAAA